MSKNNKLINNMLQIARRNRANQIAQASENLTPYVYAAIAIALHRKFGWGYIRINRAFLESQKIWENLGNEDVISICEKETGITLMNPEQAEKEGLL